MNELTTTEKYTELEEDCKAIVTESIFASKWAMVEGYWLLGQRIREDISLKRQDTYGKKILTDLSKSIGVGTRDLYRAIKFYDKVPDLTMLKEGKNITWNKVVTKYLTDGKPEAECIHEPIIICRLCRKVMDSLV